MGKQRFSRQFDAPNPTPPSRPRGSGLSLAFGLDPSLVLAQDQFAVSSDIARRAEARRTLEFGPNQRAQMLANRTAEELLRQNQAGAAFALRLKRAQAQGAEANLELNQRAAEDRSGQLSLSERRLQFDREKELRDLQTPDLSAGVTFGPTLDKKGELNPSMVTPKKWATRWNPQAGQHEFFQIEGDPIPAKLKETNITLGDGLILHEISNFETGAYIGTRVTDATGRVSLLKPAQQQQLSADFREINDIVDIGSAGVSGIAGLGKFGREAPAKSLREFQSKMTALLEKRLADGQYTEEFIRPFIETMQSIQPVVDTGIKTGDKDEGSSGFMQMIDMLKGLLPDEEEVGISAGVGPQVNVEPAPTANPPVTTDVKQQLIRGVMARDGVNEEVAIKLVEERYPGVI